MPGVVTVREHETLENRPELKEHLAELEAVAGKALTRRNGHLAVSKYVGVITTKRGLVVEVLPKIDLGDESDAATRHAFLRMLRCWRWWRRQSETLSDSAIRAISRFPMLEIFVRQFLLNLDRLARMGLARRYVTVEDNLPYLRGRLLFREQLRQNLTNHARFAVSHTPLSVNRPANRLIHTALTRLAPLVRSGDNRQLLRQLTAVFVEVPQSADPYADWREQNVDRSMQHYEPVMRWVRLFLFNHGLATLPGHHTNLSLLFPMEQVFEDFVTHSFRRYQNRYGVKAQSPKRRLARIDGKDAFEMKPDISLMDEKRVVFILDAKWKDIKSGGDDQHGIESDDMYQLYAYGKRYGCDAVALVYPRIRRFSDILPFQFFDGLTLSCLPFDVTNPKDSVGQSMQALQ